MAGRWRRLAVGVGFVGGASVGGTFGWYLGRYAWQMGEVGLIEGVLFIVSFLLLTLGLVGPLVLVRYFDRGDRLFGEPGTRVGILPVQISKPRQVGSAFGYIVTVGFYLVLAGVGMYHSGGEGVDPLEAIATFDAVGGAVLGGIAGVTLVSRLWCRLTDEQ